MKATVRWFWLHIVKNLIIALYLYPCARIGKLVQRPLGILSVNESPLIGLTFIYCMVSIDTAREVFGWLTQGQ